MTNKGFVRVIPPYLKVCIAVLVLTAFNTFILPHSHGFAMYDWFLFEGIFCIILSPLYKPRNNALVLLSIGVVILVIYFMIYFIIYFLI